MPGYRSGDTSRAGSTCSTSTSRRATRAAAARRRDLDRDHDGLISLEEGVPAYGAPAVALEPFPAPTGVSFEYSHTLRVPAGLALDRAVVVVHGMDVAGKYDETIPVACGAVDPSAPGSRHIDVRRGLRWLGLELRIAMT